MRRIGLLQIVTRSLKASPFRTIVTVLCVAIVMGTIFSTTLIVRGADDSLQIGILRMGADLIVVPKPTNPWHISQMILGHVVEHPYYIDIGAVDKVARVPGVQKATPQAYAAKLELVPGCACCPTSFSYLIGFDPPSDLVVKAWLKRFPEDLRLTDAIVGCNVAAHGQSIVIFDQVLTIRGVLDKSGTGLDDVVFVALDTLYWLATESRRLALKLYGHHVLDIYPDQISAVLVKVEPGHSVADVGLRIKLESMEQNMDLNVIYPQTLGQEARQRLSNLYDIFLTNNSIMWGLSVVLVGTVFTLTVSERHREIGVLRAIGATQRYIFKLITLEVVLLVVLGGVLGILGGTLTLHLSGQYLAKSLDVPYLWPDPPYVASLAASALGLSATTGILSALYPAISSSRMEPCNAIKRGQ